MRDCGVENKNNVSEIDQLQDKAKLASKEMEKLRKDIERLMGLREEERLQWEGKWNQEETEIRTKERQCTTTQEMEGELDGVSDEHTHRGSEA